MKKKSVTSHNYQPVAFKPAGKSQTVPGQILTLRQVVDRFRRGQNVQTFSGSYDANLPPGWENMDRLEKIDYQREHKSSVSRMCTALIDKAKREEQEKEQKKVEETEQKAKE